jgi:hypothetical protein
MRVRGTSVKECGHRFLKEGGAAFDVRLLGRLRHVIAQGRVAAKQNGDQRDEQPDDDAQDLCTPLCAAVLLDQRGPLLLLLLGMLLQSFVHRCKLRLRDPARRHERLLFGERERCVWGGHSV